MAELALVLGVVLLAVTVQTVAGFGFALLAVPLLSLVIDTKTAVVLADLLGLLSSSALAWRERAHIDRPVARRLVAGALVASPLGLLVLELAPERALRAAIGVAVALFVAMSLRRRRAGRPSARRDVAAGMVSGALNTSIGTSGPPLVMVLHDRSLGPAAFRATLSVVFSVAGVMATALFVAAGRIDGDVLARWAACLPALGVGWVVGRALHPHVRDHAFRGLVLGLLAVSALTALASAVVA